MIYLSHIFKQYTNGHRALSDINLRIPKGQLCFLTGHSGAGKTTLLKLLLLIERHSSGQLFVNGQNISTITPKQIPFYRRQIGIVFQNPQLIVNQTVFDNVALPLLIGGGSRAEIAKKVRAALDKVGLLKKEQSFPLALSAGEQQRVGIARAVVNKPPILLADEPTGNLDPDLSLEIIRLFEAFSRVGVTILMATHDLPLIARLNHPMITLKNGTLSNAPASLAGSAAR